MSYPRHISVIAAFLVVMLWSMSVDATSVLSTGPAKFVKSLGDDAIEVLSSPNTDTSERRRRYRELLDQGFAVDTIGRFALGRYWRIATPKQQSEYLVLFREFVLETYATRLDNFAGETFDVIEAQPLDDMDTMVATEIPLPDGPRIRVDYRVRAREDGYKIVDVLVEGVSLITTQRAEFSSIVNRIGIEGLLDLLRERTLRPAVTTN